MTLKEFAGKYRLKVRRDGCGDQVIVGKVGHIYDHSDGTHLGVCLLFPTKRHWTYAKKRLVEAGFEVKQDGDTEGTALFDPASSKQSRMEIRVVGARVRRVASAKQLENLRRARERSRIGRPCAPE